MIGRADAKTTSEIKLIDEQWKSTLIIRDVYHWTSESVQKQVSVYQRDQRSL